MKKQKKRQNIVLLFMNMQAHKHTKLYTFVLLYFCVRLRCLHLLIISACLLIVPNNQHNTDNRNNDNNNRNNSNNHTNDDDNRAIDRWPACLPPKVVLPNCGVVKHLAFHGVFSNVSIHTYTQSTHSIAQ